jgi:hypothetical protein
MDIRRRTDHAAYLSSHSCRRYCTDLLLIEFRFHEDGIVVETLPSQDMEYFIVNHISGHCSDWSFAYYSDQLQTGMENSKEFPKMAC